MYACIGIGVYMAMKRSPEQSQKLLFHANNIIKAFPLDKHSVDLISPIFDFTRESTAEYGGGMMESYNDVTHPISSVPYDKKSKRSVSAALKTHIMGKQGHKCNICSQSLDSSAELDHIHELQDGGSNEESNLQYLCRRCHFFKTKSERVKRRAKQSSAM
jgi:hypothetical protein